MDNISYPGLNNSSLRDEVNVYSVPPSSYYVIPNETENPADECPRISSNEVQKQKLLTMGKTYEEEYQPYVEMQPIPPQYAGRCLEERRYVGLINKPYCIPLWDQVCLKYIFGGMFEGRIDLMEFFALFKMLVMVTINSATVAINVFYNSSSTEVEWVKMTSKIVFCIEFGVVYFLFFFLIIVIIEAVIFNNISTNLAGDIAALSTKISNFSALRVLGIVSPAFAVEKILPIAQSAMGIMDYIKFIFLIIIWLCACVIAMASMVMKITQIDFTATKNITEWTFGEVIQLIGLTMNLARVDESYFTETQVLLDAVHRHFCPPGHPKDGLNRRECLYTRVCDFLGIPRFIKYEYFDVIFDYHFDFKEKQMNLTFCMKVRKMLNYLAFIFQMDNKDLRRFLQMTQSPLPFYQMGRDNFMISLKELDILGMDMALWRSDPTSMPTQKFGRKQQSQFNITYECGDCRGILDTDNSGSIDANSESEQKFRACIVRAIHPSS